MKQVVQDMQSGETKVMDVPVPSVAPNMVLVRNQASLVSPGTERSVVSFADSSLLGKARQRPDLVRQVLDKVRREGLLTTLEAVRHRLEEPLPLGYSSAGTVVEVGAGVTSVRPGDRVACGGGGYAVHAEYAMVPKNLVAKVPEGVQTEAAAFATLGSVALHGFRLLDVSVGERVAVIGLGLLGQLAMRIAQSAGCQVLGIDVSQWRVDWTEEQGLSAIHRSQAVEAAKSVSQGLGFDGVLLCADTSESDPVELAGELARDRATVVAVGAVGMDLPRRPYYDKELSFIVSRSYGPGRYDPGYEESGVDYPAGYVRWTEGRNLEAMLSLMDSGKLDPKPLITHRFDVRRAPEAYAMLTSDEAERAFGVLLEYPGEGIKTAKARRVQVHQRKPAGAVRLGAVGAGNFATNVLFPKLKDRSDIDLVGLVSVRGLSSAEAAERFGFNYAATDFQELLADDQVNTLAILTRHHLHAEQTADGLNSGRHVFCEKPLALNWEELEDVEQALGSAEGLLTVGFNRRFAPLLQEMRNFFENVAGPRVIQYRVNAGALPEGHWLLDPVVGGGRLIGEGCHFIDAICFLAESEPVQVYARPLGAGANGDFVLTLDLADGSVGSVVYASGGDRAQGKERVEVFGGGRSAVLEDFRRLVTYSGGRSQTKRSLMRQNKGHGALWEAFINSVSAGGDPPIDYASLLSVSVATLAAADSLQSGAPVHLSERAHSGET
ncbi:MAG: bi-domain-containing oxidoreductase [Anaerolineales bacterium]